MGRLDGKVALVTGGSGGIGSATLRRFAAEGAAVVCTDINDEGGEKLVAELSSSGATALYKHCDVTSAALLQLTAAPPPSKPKLYASVWGAESSVPTFSVWRYCEKHGHAPPSIPAPPISDMKAWFAEYGKPKIDCPPGESPCSNL